MNKHKDKKIVFMGTPDFAISSLECLVKNGYDVVAVYTQPDRPKGRGHKLCYTPVKEEALKHGIEILQPVNFKDENEVLKLKHINPDIIIVVAYGIILPEAILNIPKHGCVNIHGSILPKYRGAAPIQRAVMNGDIQTGVSAMLMDKGMDTGDVLNIYKSDINDDETAGDLFARLSELGSLLLMETIEQIFDGTAVRVKQNNLLSSYAPMIRKSDTRIDFGKKADEIINLVRGLCPSPAAEFLLNQKRIKIYKAEIADFRSKDCGVIIAADKTSGLVVSCADGAVRFTKIKPEGGRLMSASEYLAGNKIEAGTIISSMED